MCISNLVPKEETQVQVGNFACSIVSLHRLVSPSLIIRTSILDVRRSIRLNKAIMKLQEEQQNHKEHLVEVSCLEKSEKTSRKSKEPSKFEQRRVICSSLDSSAHFEEEKKVANIASFASESDESNTDKTSPGND